MENWISNPLGVVQEIFDKSTDTNWPNEVTTFFKEKLSDPNSLYSIPSLNHCKLDKLAPNSLIRFRGMIQDMFDPEFYLGSYEIRDLRNEKISRRCGWFRDVIPHEPHIIVDLNSNRNKTDERLSYYCVPIPGESRWVNEVYGGKCNVRETTLTACVSQQVAKRGHEECSCENPNSNNVESNGADTLASGEIGRESSDQVLDEMHNKKIRISENHENSSKSEYARPESGSNNSPPNSDGVACIVKMYVEKESYILNDCVEFVGVLSVEPALAYSTEMNDEAQSALLNAGEEMELDQPQFPPSLVPRIHVICSYKMEHNNPLLPPMMSSTEGKTERDSVLNAASSIRAHLHAILEQALLGDNLAADFLICHLVSSVYARSEIVALGKFSLNLSNAPANNDFTRRLFELLEMFSTKICPFTITLSNMNTLTLIPKKDYKTNKLITGALQLSENTNLVIDETGLSNGRLEPQGVRNMAALGNLISWQTVEYDFHFHVMKYTANVAALVLSEGKSLLPSDCHVPLRPTIQPDSANFNAIATYLTPSLLYQIRRFLTVLRLVEYNISEDMQKAVQEDFVESRRQDSSNMTSDDLHFLLVLARLLSISEGQTTLTQATWEKARRMELERKMRLSSAN